MCRICILNNPLLTDKSIRTIVRYIHNQQKTHIGDGFGIGWIPRGENSISVLKDSKLNDENRIANLIIETTKKGSPVFCHWRKASSGTVNTHNNHPVATTLGAKWHKEGDNSLRAEGLDKILIHNGTISAHNFREYRRELVLSREFEAHQLIGITDTQFLGYIYGAFGRDALTFYTGFGLVVGLQNDGTVEVAKTTDRDLYYVHWDEDRWMLISNLSLHLAESLVKDTGAKIREVPNIVCGVNSYLSYSIEKEYMDENEIRRTFRYKTNHTHTPHQGSYNWDSYNNKNSSDTNSGDDGGKKKKGNGRSGNGAIVLPGRDNDVAKERARMESMVFVLRNDEIVPIDT